MTTQTEQQFQFFRLLFKINTKQDLRGLLNFLVQQQTTEKKQENHRQLVNKTKLFVEFLETHPTLKLDYDLGINKGCNLWNYCEDNPNKSDYNINDLVVNIYKYADCISVNIHNLSVSHKDVLNEIIQFLKKRFPIEPTENNIVENMKTLKHRRELELFICFFDKILKSKEIQGNTPYVIIGKMHNILYDKNSDSWNKLQGIEDHIKEIKGGYDVLNLEYPELNQFFYV